VEVHEHLLRFPANWDPVRKEYLPKLAPFDMKLLCDKRLTRAIKILSD